jgi:UDP-N-acetylmuramate-alanine ligase
MELKKKNDIILTMGAGDIWKYGEVLNCGKQ